MKKIISIALLCAMLLSCFAGCAMQKGEVDVENYVDEVEIEEAATSFKTQLDANASKYSGTPDISWFDENSKTKTHTLTSADQLVGFRNLLAANKQFKGWTITLGCDVDLNGAALAAYCTADTEYSFYGTFDGAKHVIANWSITASVREAGFFCNLASGSIVKNVSFINGTITASGQTQVGLIGKVWSGKGSTVKVENVYSNINIKGGDSVGGIIGSKGGEGALIVKNCEFVGNIEATGGAVAGIVGYLTNSTVATGVSVEDVPEVTSISEGKASVIIEKCKVTATQIKGSTQVAGVLGRVSAPSDYAVLVKDCSVTSKTVAASTMSGGLVGYVDKAVPIVIVGCNVAGSYEGYRTSGGLIGTLNAGSKQCAIRDCEMTATLKISLTDKYNNAGGGLIGKLQSPLNLTNCDVDAKMDFIYTPGALKTDSDYGNGAGGLIGRVFTKESVNINDCSVDGEITFKYGTYKEDKLYAGRLIGSIGNGNGKYNPESCKVSFGENIIVSPDLKVTFEGDPTNFNYESECCAPEIAAMGYQTRANKDNKDAYDLRYVFAISDSVANTADVGVGATVTIRFVDSTGKLNEKTQTAYASEIYTAIVDEDEKTYSAEAFNYKYVYTVVIEGIPAGYTLDANNVEITLDAFSATKTGDVVTTLESCTLVHGQIVTNP